MLGFEQILKASTQDEPTIRQSRPILARPTQSKPNPICEEEEEGEGEREGGERGMDVYSWLRRSISRPQKTSTSSVANGQGKKQEDEAEICGVTDQLIDFINTFTIDIFKNFPLRDEEAANCGEGATGNVRKDLSEWQERHATLVLSKVKEMSQLRFRLCPGWMKERQFWRIYFTLVKSYIAEYELRAIQLEKLRQMTIENKDVPNTSAYEVEMAETKQATVRPSASSEHNLDSLTHDIESGKE